MTTVFPLLHYPVPSNGTRSLGLDRKQLNLSPTFLQHLAISLGLRISQGIIEDLNPTAILNYIYAIFHSRSYRARYQASLAIDFARLSFPRSLPLVRELSQCGGELVAMHLMESPQLEGAPQRFIGRPLPRVDKVSFTNQTIWLDQAQTCGFHNVPEEVWNFHIGSYRICDKWLKDRKGRSLSSDDIAHYGKIVAAISETVHIMTKIDQIIQEHGGWPGAFA